MTTRTRTTLSAAALGLASFTITSVFTSGLFAVPTIVGFALLAVYGLVEIALVSYAPPRAVFSQPASARVVAPVTATAAVRRVPAVIEYPAIHRRPAGHACAA